MSHRHFTGLVVIVVFAGLVAGCEGGSSKGRPSPLASVQVVGPDSLLAGRSAQFSVNIRDADGTTKSATSMPTLRWASSNTSLMSVSDSGMVTAASSRSGEAVITAEVVMPVGLRTDSIQGTHKVVIQHRAEVTAKLEVTKDGTPAQPSYVFAITLAESAGVPATITDLWMSFDDGWSGQCNWTPDKLRQTRLPANGTVTLDQLTCSGAYDEAKVDVEVYLKDDNGYLTSAFVNRERLVR